MAAWEDVRRFLEEHYRVTEADDERLGVLLSFDNQRRQHVTVYRFEAYDRQWLGFETRICRKELLEPEEACRLNVKMPVGHVALDSEGFYVARHTALLDTLDLDELLLPLHVVTSLADKLEEELTGRDVW